MFDVFRAELLRFPSDIFAFFLRKSGFSVNLWKCAAADRDGHFLLSPTKGKCLLALTGHKVKMKNLLGEKMIQNEQIFLAEYAICLRCEVN